jgi:toxin-antitoxin system PIN domain toxin
VIAIDTNVLVYAHREEYPLHAQAKARIIGLAMGAGPWGVPVFCLGEFVRVVTRRRVLNPPSSLEQAVAFLERLTESDSFRVLLADAEYWADLKAAIELAAARGNLVLDAQIAALCVRHGATLLTADRDFARFSIKTETL